MFKKGIKQTEEHKQKRMTSMAWFYKNLRGSKLSEETKNKISISHKEKPNSGVFKKGHVNPHKGMKKSPMSDEIKEKIRLSNLGKHTSKIILRGEKHPNWRGGRTPVLILIRECFKYRQWRSDVFTRDNFTCQECGENKGGNLNADHIKPFIFLIKQGNITNVEQALQYESLWNINNGRTLCEPCHRKTETYGEGAKKFIEGIV